MPNRRFWITLAVAAAGVGCARLVYSHGAQRPAVFPVVLNGRVLTVQSPTFVVRRNTWEGGIPQVVTIVVDEDTRIAWINGAGADFSGIGIGGKVLVRGDRHEGSTVHADRITITVVGRPSEGLPAPTPGVQNPPPAPPAPGPSVQDPPPGPPSSPPSGQISPPQPASSGGTPGAPRTVRRKRAW